MKKSKSYYKERYRYYREMNEHHKDLYNVSFKELKFSRLQIDHYKSILDEVDVLLEKGVKNSLIRKVIELGKKRAMLDASIHYDLECGGIKGLNDK